MFSCDKKTIFQFFLIMTCKAKIKTGQRQGETCDRIVKDGESMCGYHRLKSDNDGRKTPKTILFNRSVIGSVSSLISLKNKLDEISEALNQQGAVLIWKCMCGKVICSDTIQLNRQNIYLGLGIPKKSKYKTCIKCHTLKCSKCDKYQTCSECDESKIKKSRLIRRKKNILKAIAITDELIVKNEAEIPNAKTDVEIEERVITETRTEEKIVVPKNNNHSRGFGVSRRKKKV